MCWDNCYVSGGIGSLLRVIVLENIIECYKVDRILWENINDWNKSVDFFFLDVFFFS